MRKNRIGLSLGLIGMTLFALTAVLMFSVRSIKLSLTLLLV